MRFGAHLVKHNMLTVYPLYSMLRNIGGDGSGVHSTVEDDANLNVDLSRAIADPKIEFIPPDPEISKLLKKHYSGGIVSDLKRFAARTLILCKERMK